MKTTRANPEPQQLNTIRLGLMYAGVLLPYLWISQYIYPSGDDYSYAWKGIVSNDFMTTLQGEWHTWNGRYFSNIFVLINPITSDDFGLYQAVPILLISLFIVLNFTLLKTTLPVTFSQALFLVFSFTLIYFSTLPDVGEGLYWYTSTVTYLLPVALFPLYLMVLARSTAQRALSCLQYTSSSATIILLQAVLTGCNEIMMLLLLVIHVGVLFMQKQTAFATRILLLLTQIGFSSFVFFAPGNEVRSSYFTTQHNVIHTLFNGGANTLRFSLLLLINPILWISLLLIKKLVGPAQLLKTSFSNWTWLLLFLTPQFIACAGPVWTTGIIGQHRTPNFALYFQLVVVFCFFFSKTEHFIVKKAAMMAKKNNIKLLSLCLLISLLFWGNNALVLKDLFTGNAACFEKENIQRIEHLKTLSQVKDSVVIMYPYQCTPASIFIYDISSNPRDWKNEAYTLFFNLKQNGVQIRTKP